jgi:orotate phosphoribosyltransferase
MGVGESDGLEKSRQRAISIHALKIGAIKLNPREPFQWASGYFMPIYNDNRLLLGYIDARKEVLEGITSYIINGNFDVIAGTSTAGIPWASMVADRLDKPMIYVRDKPKVHGLRNQIEGIDASRSLEGRKVVLIEDLISTGGSSAKAVQAIRDADGDINHCISIFNYGFDEARDMFEGKTPFDEGKILAGGCNVESMAEYPVLLKVARDTKYISDSDVDMLAEWRSDPFNWGERHGFHPIKKQ